MKKRSLFAAIAMLIVSAIVLTSATYAWFASSAAEVKVNNIGASVSASDGSLLLKANYHKAEANPEWKPVLSDTDFTSIPSSLHPVSFELTGTPGSYSAVAGVVKVDYDGENFAPAAAAASDADDYIHYSFDVQLSTASATGKTVTMTPAFTRGADFIYAIVKIGNDLYLYDGGSSDSFVPVKAITAAVDNGTSGTKAIIDSADTGTYTLGSQTQTGQAVSAITLWSNQAAATEGTRSDYQKTVEVYVWAEGNDANCKGTASANTSINFTFAVV